MCLFPPPNLPPSFEVKKKKKSPDGIPATSSPPPPLLPGDEWRHLTSADTGFKCTIRPRRDLNKLISECYLVRAEPLSFHRHHRKYKERWRRSAGILVPVLLCDCTSQELVFEGDVEESRWRGGASQTSWLFNVTQCGTNGPAVIHLSLASFPA